MISKIPLRVFAACVLLAVPVSSRAQSSDKPVEKTGATSEDPHEVAVQILDDLRLVDAAIDQWLIEENKRAGVAVDLKSIAKYLKPGSRLQKAAATGEILDALGNPLVIHPGGEGGSNATVSPKTADQLSEVADAKFWGAYAAR